MAQIIDLTGYESPLIRQGQFAQQNLSRAFENETARRERADQQDYSRALQAASTGTNYGGKYGNVFSGLASDVVTEREAAIADRNRSIQNQVENKLLNFAQQGYVLPGASPEIQPAITSIADNVNQGRVNDQEERALRIQALESEIQKKSRELNLDRVNPFYINASDEEFSAAISDIAPEEQSFHWAVRNEKKKAVNALTNLTDSYDSLIAASSKNAANNPEYFPSYASALNARNNIIMQAAQSGIDLTEGQGAQPPPAFATPLNTSGEIKVDPVYSPAFTPSEGISRGFNRMFESNLEGNKSNRSLAEDNFDLLTQEAKRIASLPNTDPEKSKKSGMILQSFSDMQEGNFDTPAVSELLQQALRP